MEEKQTQKPAQEKKKEPELWRCVLTEVIGTFALTFVAAGGEAIDAVSHGEVGHSAKVVAPGLLVMAFIYAMGDTSGAHFNPAVTLAFALRRAFPWLKIAPYWGAQITGAISAALLLRALFGLEGHLGATLPKTVPNIAFVMEVVLSCLLLTVILGTATRFSLVGPNAALAVGGTIALCGLFASPISGASMNPARSLGPALVAGYLDSVWIYLIAPFIASFLVTGLMNLLHDHTDPKEEEAAKGKLKA